MKKYLKLLIFIITIGLTLFESCSKSNSSINNTQITSSAPTISSLSVLTGGYTTAVTISGTNFSSSINDDQVLFNGVTATVTAATSTQLSVTVPKGAGTGPVSVIVKGNAVTGPVFTYVLSAVVTTVAGSNIYGVINGPIATATLGGLWGIVKDASGNIFVSDSSQIRKIGIDNTASSFAGRNFKNGFPIVTDGKGTDAVFNFPTGMTIDAANNIYVADYDRIRKILPDGTVTTIVYLTGSIFTAVAIDASGNIFATDVSNNNSIRKITPSGTVSTFAGSGSSGSVNGMGTAASFNQPIALTIDALGNLFIADQGSNLIRKITPSGLVSTVAGAGKSGITNGQASNSSFANLTGIAVDASGNLYVSSYNCIIYKITPDGIVNTLAGSGDRKSVDGVGVNASFTYPQNLIVDSTGAIYVAEGAHVRKIILQ